MPLAPPQSTENQLGNHLVAEFLRVHAVAPHVAVAAADTALEIMAPAWPECAPMFGTAQQEADWWGEFASDTMVTAMLSACLKRIVRTRLVAAGARKKALVAIWNTLDEKDRIAFLEFVDPSGARKE